MNLVFGINKAKPPSGWIACAPQGERAAIALVETPPGGKPAVRWVAEEPWTDPRATLQRLKRQRGVARHRRVALLQRPQYHCVVMDAPPEVPREDWAAASRWQLRDAVEFPIDSAAVDVLAIPPGASYRAQPQLIAVAAAEAEMRPLVAAGHGAGLPWQAIDIGETALRNLCLLVAPPERAQALLHCHAGHATIVVTWQGELLSTRQMELALLDLAARPGPERQAAFEQAALELQRTLDGIERAFGQVTLASVLVTPMPGIDALCEHLKPLLYVPVLPLALHDALDWADTPGLLDDPARLNALVLAIGAALREG